MKKTIFTLFLLLLALASYAQLTPELAAKLAPKASVGYNTETIKPSDYVLQGVGEWFNGTDFKYFFPVKGIHKTLLIRATDGTQSMEWETANIPADLGDKKFVNFVIPVAIGNNSPLFKMDFKISGKTAFTIDNRDEQSWHMADKLGRTLTFESIHIDGNRDRRGFFYLRIPKNQLPSDNAPLKMSITADNRGSQAWFMIFTDPIVPDVKVQLSPAIIDNRQQLMVDVMHFGAPVNTDVRIDGKSVGTKTVVMGNNSFVVPIDRVKTQREALVEIEANGAIEQLKVQLKPSRDWEVLFVQHSHTDIGYTRPQNEILAEHIRYIDYALDYCDATDHLPKEAQFHWTCEATWPVEQFLLTRPKKQIERLKKRIKEGRIEVTGMLFNLSELPDEHTLVESLQPIKACHAAGIKVESAMQNDVNGMPWALADYLPSIGVKYLTMGTHGHRALICFDYPTVFRWQSPSGSEMLAYRAEHYNTGNFFGVEKTDFEAFEIRLLTYLNELEAKGYPYDLAAIQFSGYFTDNSPPSLAACNNIQQWNEKYTLPRIKLALSSEFIKRIEREHYNELPVLRQAWPDWWTDGFGAAARETAVGRYAKSEIVTVKSLFSMAALNGTQIPEAVYGDIDQVNDAIMFYDEHTAGYSESVRQPWSKATMDQRALKESYVWEAYRRSRTLNETALGLLQTNIQHAKTPSIVIYNTLNFPRTGIAEVYIDHEILPIDREFSIIDPSTGKPVEAQSLNSRTDGTYWQIRVENIPAMGSKQLLIVSADTKKQKAIHNTQLPNMVENKFYKLTFDSTNASISSLYDKELGKELLDKVNGHNLGEFIHEKLTERGSMEAFTMGDHSRHGLDSVWFVSHNRGAIYDSYNFSGLTATGVDTPSSNFGFELRLHHNDKLIEMVYSLVKKSIVEPEGIYIALPFGLENSKIYCELSGGAIEAGVDQIKGSSNDWNTHQNFVSVRGKEAQIIMGSAEAPLMQFGAINTGRYDAGALPSSSNVYSWVMNNYWVTNFNAEQRGEYVWSYYLTSTSDVSHKTATEFGWNERTPFPTRIISGQRGAKELSKPVVEGIKIEGGDLLLISTTAIQGERALLLHIREIGGRKSTVSVAGYQLRACNVLGEELKNNTLDVTPYGVKFVKLLY